MKSDSGLCQKIRERIKSSDLWGAKSKESRGHFYGLKCPECGKAEAWAYLEAPFAVVCNRKNECGARTRTLELFPDLVVDIEKDYAPTHADPHRPAREYLRSRGLNRSLDGLVFQYWKDIRKTGSGGVMFLVGKNPAGESVWNGRLFNPPAGEDKSHNKGATVGLLWKHPGIEYDPNKPTYITEGIIDALSLIEMGMQAVSILSAGQDPSKFDLGPLAGKMVMALDENAAGAEGLIKWKRQFVNTGCIAPITGDWNDFLRARGPGVAAKAFQEALPEFEARASLLLAETAQAYAQSFYDFYERSPYLFEFQSAYHYATVNESAKVPVVKARRVSNFVLGVEHYQKDTTNEEEPVHSYYVKVRKKVGRPSCFVLSASDLSTPGNIRKTLMERANVMWEGKDSESTALAKKIVNTDAPVVRQLFRIGHDPTSDAFVFKNFLIDRSGRMIDPDKKGFFKLARNEFVGPSTQICLKPRRGVPIKHIYELMQQAWPETGGLVFAFTVASWFVNKVKPELGFFPFCSIWGDTQTGKSRLVRIGNAMQCLDDEGLPLTKVNTAKGEMRKLAQRSGLFQALIEANREENVRFDFDVLLPMYNHGNPIRVTAVKSNDLKTQETMFMGSLLFAQNREQFKSKAQMERVVSGRKMLTEDINAKTREAYDELTRIPPREIAWTFVEILSARKEIESSWVKQYETARDEIIRKVQDNRIAENHAVFLAFHRMATKIIGVEHDLFPYMVEIAAAKHEKCSHREATPADHFFETLDGLSEADDAYFKYAEERDGVLHLKMGAALQAMEKRGVRFMVGQLYGELKEHPAFLKSNVSYRGYWGGTFEGGTTKVWKFDLRKL